MPTYEYRCTTCGTAFEQRRSMTDATEPRCPEGHAAIRRVFSVFAAAKGGGSDAPMAAPMGGGGCCGGGCGCG